MSLSRNQRSTGAVEKLQFKMFSLDEEKNSSTRGMGWLETGYVGTFPSRR